jgi:outer membrane protein insertion porin family
MKATSRFRCAASAAAISAGLLLSGASVAQFAGVTQAAAQAASISVRGNERVDAETIRNYVGRPATNAEIDEAVKRLFDTGLFSDVRINRSGNTLIVQVVEHSIVNQVVFRGNRRVRDNQLEAATQLGPRRAYSEALLQADLEAIRAAYVRTGRSDVVVDYEVVDLGSNRVNIIYNIQEGGRTRIASIAFHGNSAYSDRRLREVITTKQTNILSWLTRNDVFDEDRLRADEEALRRFYFNRGYADFRVISAYGELDEARNEYTINFTIDEGERYTFGSIEIDSTIPGVDAERLRGAISTREGRVYSARDVEDTLIALTERVAGMGYAFAEVLPRGDRDFANRTISIVYTIDQGPRTYVERIEIRGNTRTRDYVIRREFDIVEGDAFNQVLVQRARRRLEALDFFESINISTAPGSQPDQVVLVVDLVEKATGEFSIGGGYTTGGDDASRGFSVEASVTERNFLGRGQYLRAAIGASENGQTFDFSFTEPHFMGLDIAAGVDVYHRIVNESSRNYYGYQATGGQLRVGVPLTSSLSVTGFSGLERKIIDDTETHDHDDNDATPEVPDPFASAFVNDDEEYWKYFIGYTLTYNGVDDRRNPTSGLLATFTQQYIGWDFNLLKTEGRARYYMPLIEDSGIIASVRGQAGIIHDLDDDGVHPLEAFYPGSQLVRGFQSRGMGPRLLDSGEPVGTTMYAGVSAEIEFPLPVLPENYGLSGAVWADAGWIGDAADNFGLAIDPDSENEPWRTSIGASIIWDSPFGPLRGDFAHVLSESITDNTQVFQLTMQNSL